MKTSIWFIALVTLVRIGFAQAIQKDSVTFHVHSPDLPDTTRVYIAGSLPQLGSWHPSTVQLKFEGEKNWSTTVVLEHGKSIEYKFTLGTWELEAANANGAPLTNFALQVNSDTTASHIINFWTQGVQKNIPGQVTGTVRYHRQLTADGLHPRDVIVWLPPGYENNKRRKYPVLYMHDGQNMMDPKTSSFGVDWRLDESSDSLIRKKVVDPYIIVGIYNTVNRTAEYTPGETGCAYMDFVVNKLKPLVDATYRTKSNRKNTWVGGSSAGGLISFMLAWEHPQVFSAAICMSPALRIMHIDYVKTVQQTQEKRNVFFYLDNGGVALETELQPGLDAMINTLVHKGYKEGVDYLVVIDPSARHFEAAWGKRFPKAILSISKKK